MQTCESKIPACTWTNLGGVLSDQRTSWYAGPLVLAALTVLSFCRCSVDGALRTRGDSVLCRPDRGVSRQCCAAWR